MRGAFPLIYLRLNVAFDCDAEGDEWRPDLAARHGAPRVRRSMLLGRRAPPASGECPCPVRRALDLYALRSALAPELLVVVLRRW